MADEAGKTEINMSNSRDNESYLDDEKPSTPSQFKGATLEIDAAATTGDDPNVSVRGTQNTSSSISIVSDEMGAGDFDRNRPGSTMSRSSHLSTTSRTSLSTTILQTDVTANRYFCKKIESFDNAVDVCRDSVMKTELDGELRGAWLLTEIDHWDSEREKIMLITDNSLLNIRYDFVTNKVSSSARITLKRIVKLQQGDIIYPEKSLMWNRDHGGLRIIWGDTTALSFGQKWNPWCSDIPYTTVAHHPIIYNEKERETVTYNVDDFAESLQQAVTIAQKSSGGASNLTMVEEPIQVDTYASVYSMVFNQSHLGFNRDRGGVSF